MENFNPDGVIAKIFEYSVALGILAVIGIVLWRWGSDGNNKRIEEIKENNKILTEAFQKETEAKFALAQATNKQTETMREQADATKLLSDRLLRVELALEGIKAKS